MSYKVVRDDGTKTVIAQRIDSKYYALRWAFNDAILKLEVADRENSSPRMKIDPDEIFMSTDNEVFYWRIEKE